MSVEASAARISDRVMRNLAISPGRAADG